MTTKRTLMVAAVLAVTAVFINVSPVHAQGKGVSEKTQRVIDHWTPERRAAAIPRDLVIDERGLGYLRKPDGSLEPYGHSIAANQIRALSKPAPRKGPPGGGDSSDTTPPSISNMDPADITIGSSYTFSATVTDDSGIKSVSFVITYPDGATTQSFSPGSADGINWSITLQGFSDGNWSWHVVAKDRAGKGGNTASTENNKTHFTVDTGGSSGGGGGSGGSGGSYIVTNAEWTSGGTVQTAAGRIYFYMPANSKWKGPWNGYVCSGTVVTDGASNRSVIITAAHCVYDDANKAFARDVLFIPNQADTTASGTNRNCSDDPMGCWVPDFGVVDVNWTTRTFPDNIPWDYAYYVVKNSGAHVGAAATSDALDTAAGSLAVSFDMPFVDDGDPSASSIDFTHALGYSYSEDPNFMYCAEDMTTEGSANWWLPSCGLSGGSSGGSWLQPVDSGNGPIISVNSWGYTTSPGMAGPLLVGTSAECLFTIATTEDPDSVPDADGEAGVPQNCP